MEIIELVNAYRQETGLEKKVELARLLYDTVKQNLRVRFHNKVPPSFMDDILQDTLIAIFHSLEKFRGKSNDEFWKWCNRIFFFKRSDLFRDRYNAKREPLPPDELLLAMEKSGEIESISRDEKLDLEDAANLLKNLEPGCRRLLWKRYAIPMKLRDVAKEISLKSDVVRMRIKRCLDKLRGLI